MNEDYDDLDTQLAESWGGRYLSESGCLERNLKDYIKTDAYLDMHLFCINENCFPLLISFIYPHYIYIYIYTHTHTHTWAGIAQSV